VEQLVGVSEIATMLGGISRERVHQLTRHADFPKPVAVLRMGKVWTAQSIRDWMIATGRTELL
jgi:prophage regulatory protein